MKEITMNRTLGIFAGLSMAFLLADSSGVPAQVEREGAYYNPYNGASGAAREGYNPYTGREGATENRYNPYTGRDVSKTEVYNPYTGRSAVERSVSNPYTGRSTASYAYRRR
jgi:hypothetical protein